MRSIFAKGTARRFPRMLLALSVAAAVGGFAAPSGAETAAEFPSKALTLVVPWAPGGSSDLAARVVADQMQKEFDWSVKIENRPGAGSAVGLQYLATRRPDGYSFGLITSSLITNPILGHANVDYTMFDPLRLTHISPGAVAVNAAAPWKTLSELIEEASSNPNRVRMGNNGTGSTWHLLTSLVEDATGAKFVAVPYEGGGDLVAAVLGDHIEAAMQSTVGWLPTAKAGQTRILGISAAERMEQLPDVPTFKEQGIDIEYGLLVGFVVPKGTPEDIRLELSDALSEIVQKPAFIEFANAQGAIIINQSPEETAATLQREHDTMTMLAAEHFQQ